MKCLIRNKIRYRSNFLWNRRGHNACCRMSFIPSLDLFIKRHFSFFKTCSQICFKNRSGQWAVYNFKSPTQSKEIEIPLKIAHGFFLCKTIYGLNKTTFIKHKRWNAWRFIYTSDFRGRFCIKLMHFQNIIILHERSERSERSEVKRYQKQA